MMYKSQYYRQFILLNLDHKNIIFKYDLVYSLIIMPIIPLLYIINGEKFISLAFLISSLISILIFSMLLKNFKKS